VLLNKLEPGKSLFYQPEQQVTKNYETIRGLLDYQKRPNRWSPIAKTSAIKQQRKGVHGAIWRNFVKDEGN